MVKALLADVLFGTLAAGILLGVLIPFLPDPGSRPWIVPAAWIAAIVLCSLIRRTVVGRAH